MKNALGATHLPQHVHMQAALAGGYLIGHARLVDPAADRVGDQLLMPLAPRLAVIHLRQHVAVGIVGIGIDAGEGANPVARSPGAGAFAVGNGDALAALDQRPDLAAGDDDGLQCLQWVSLPGASLPPASVSCKAPGLSVMMLSAPQP